MSLEDALAANTAALEANTAAILAGGVAPAAASAKPAAKPKPAAAAKPAASKFTADQVRDTLINVKTNVGEDEAKRIISEIGGYEKLAQLIADPSKFDAVMEASEAALAGGDEEGDSGL